MRSIHSQALFSLVVLLLWRNIPYLYARLKEAYGSADETAEDLCQHLHIAHDDIVITLNGGDQEAEDTYD